MHFVTAFFFIISCVGEIGNKKRAVDEFRIIWYDNIGDVYGNAKQKTK
jgi:hypothetical protein